MSYQRGHDDRYPYRCHGRINQGRSDCRCLNYASEYAYPDGKHYCRKHSIQGSPLMTNSNSNYDAIAREREALTERLSQLAQREAILEARPKEPLQEDAVVWFQKVFGTRTGYGIKYTYVAFKIAANGRWYISAQMGNRSYDSWESLLDFIYSDEAEDALPQIWVVTDFEEVL